MSKFPEAIRHFGEMFVQAQIRRYSADYDPAPTYTRSEVLADIKVAEAVIIGFRTAHVRDRRAFAAWVTFPRRQN